MVIERSRKTELLGKLTGICEYFPGVLLWFLTLHACRLVVGTMFLKLTLALVFGHRGLIV